jgi:hypothetical protein
MTTDLEQNLFDLLFDNPSVQAANGAVAMCTTETERDHALWIAIAYQNVVALNAILDKGTSILAREAGLILLCRGLVMIGDAPADASVGDWSARTIISPVRNGTSAFWGDAEEAMCRYLDKRGHHEGAWLAMLPELLEGIPSADLIRITSVLIQADSAEITTAKAMLTSELERRQLEAV